jgi:hypothetical protein
MKMSITILRESVTTERDEHSNILQSRRYCLSQPVPCLMTHTQLNIRTTRFRFVWTSNICDFAVFFTLLLVSWATGKFGTTSIVGIIGSIIVLLIARAKLPLSTPFSCILDGIQATTQCTIGNQKLRIKNS